MEKQEVEEKVEKYVDLIASGYEWTCPECECFNKIMGVSPTIECDNCSKEFEVGEVHHAYD